LLLKMPASLNRYVYGGDDPINRVDTSGNSFEPSCDGSICFPDPIPPTGGTAVNLLGLLNRILSMSLWGSVPPLPPAWFPVSLKLDIDEYTNGAVVVPLCVAQPQLCVAVVVGGTVIMVIVYGDRIEEFFRLLCEAVRKTAMDYMPPFAKAWPGDDHWHWIEWNLNRKTCTYFKQPRSGPNDPGPQYREVPR